MNHHHLQVSESEEKEEEFFQELLQSHNQIQHFQQTEWSNFTSPGPTLVSKHQNNTHCCPSHKEEINEVSLKKKPKRAKPDVVEGHRGRIACATGRKDRHSKVSTATGPRDRRVRLSPNTAIQFYDVQDRLGYDRPSKAIDWLIKESKAAIDALENPFQVFSKKIDSTNKELNRQTISKYAHQFAEQFPGDGYKEESPKVSEENGNSTKYVCGVENQQLNDSPIKNLSLFSSTNVSKIQFLSESQSYPEGHFQSETNLSEAQGSFFNLQSSQDLLQTSIPLNSISNLEVREDSTFSFLSQHFPTVIGQREPLQSSYFVQSSVPLSTISYANNGFVNDALLGPIIQEEEEEEEEEEEDQGNISTPSAMATSLLYNQQ